MNYFAKKGRYGDTKIRNIDGKPAHVNSNEASLLDLLGRPAEDIIKMVGAGTINPMTGLNEYHMIGYEEDEECNVTNEGTEHSDSQWDVDGHHRHWSGRRLTTYPGYGNEDNPLTEDIEGPVQHQYGGFTTDDFDKFMQMFETGSMQSYAKEQFGVSKDKFDKFVTDPSVELKKITDVENLYDIRRGELLGTTEDALSKMTNIAGKSGFATSGSADAARERLIENYGKKMTEELTKHRQDVTNIKGDIIGGFYTQMGQLT